MLRIPKYGDGTACVDNISRDSYWSLEKTWSLEDFWRWIRRKPAFLFLLEVVWLWRRCLLMNFRPLMRAYHDLQTYLNRNKDTTGNHSKICITKSSGSTSLVVNIAFLPLISWVTQRGKWMINKHRDEKLFGLGWRIELFCLDFRRIEEENYIYIYI